MEDQSIQSDGGQSRKLLNHTQLMIISLFKSNTQLLMSDITRRTNLSKTTIAKILNRFESLQIITTVGKGESTEFGGKKPTIFALNSKYCYTIAISITSPDRIVFALLDFGGNSLYFKDLPVKSDTPYETVITLIAKEISHVIKANSIPLSKLCGVFIGCEGIINSKKGIILFPINPHWKENRNIKQDIANALPFKTKIYIDSTYRFSAYAELLNEENWEGNKLVLIWDETMLFGGCMLSDMVFMEGNTDVVGEFPHIIIDSTAPNVCSCGRRGCIGSILSEEGACEYISRTWKKYPDSLISKKFNEGSFKVVDFFQEAHNGDAFSCDLLDHVIYYYSILIHNVISLHSARKVILQGMFRLSGDYFVLGLKDKVHHFNTFNIHDNLDIVYSESNDDPTYYPYKNFLRGTELFSSNNYFKNMFM